ncbi:hypothetical protein PN498_27670 [Oscillatoria sp. CS-180]|uniref:hypothetical protein n=1 Tax=Oscillatoria sp. CS-180 TaxID=3021720 RepID=UPI002330838D|nr:hypothetical protein [Oscillatoria sp. CS-180]MDB9529797.1 hypothetical protein [Oscillatoria sp. CS-180]
MRWLYFFAGLALMLLGIYFLGQNILFTTHAYPWWRGIAADLSVVSLCLGLFMIVFLKGDARTLGWIAVGFGIVCVFVSSRAILNTTSLWQFFLAFGAMSFGYKMMMTRRSPF